MEETKVTMTLDRFRSLENSEKIVLMLKNNEELYVFINYRMETIILTKNEMMETLIKEKEQAIRDFDALITKIRFYEAKHRVSI